MTGLRVVHNAHHYALGLRRWTTEWVMFVMSVLMLGSMHAVQRNHLRHHKYCMDDEDLEGYSARLSAWQALLYGPVFPVMLHVRALRLGRRRHRFWILAELAANAMWIGFVCFYGPFVLWYHVAVMAVGQCMTSFFAVWTVHHDCDRSLHIARTLRGKLKNRISFEMFFHLEHHLFPKVPTCHLPKLAERLDQAAPELQARQVL